MRIFYGAYDFNQSNRPFLKKHTKYKIILVELAAFSIAVEVC